MGEGAADFEWKISAMASLGTEGAAGRVARRFRTSAEPGRGQLRTGSADGAEMRMAVPALPEADGPVVPPRTEAPVPAGRFPKANTFAN